MYELRAFDDNWNIIKDLDSDDMEIAIEVSEFMTSGTKPKNVFARQLSRIMPKPIHTAFIEAMLFAGTPEETISEKSDLPIKLILLYKTLFFDTDEFLGRLDKVEYFQSLLNNNKPGDGEHTKGILFQSSFSYGWKFVTTNFHMDDNHEFNTGIMEVMARSAFYRWNGDNLDGRNTKSYYRDTKEVLSIVDNTIKAKESNSDEKSLGLMSAMMDMNEEFSERPKIMVVPLYDVSRSKFSDQNKVIDMETSEILETKRLESKDDN